MSLPSKWRDGPAVYADPADADRWLRLLFLHVVEDVAPDSGPDFWRAGQTAEGWAARWLPGVPWGVAVARDLWRAADEVRPFTRPGVRALPLVSSEPATWGDPPEPIQRDGEQVTSWAVRWRRWEAAERRRLAAVPGLRRAKVIDPDHLRWLARKLHGATYTRIAHDVWPHIRTSRELDSRVVIVRRALKHAAARLGIPMAALRYKKRSL